MKLYTSLSHSKLGNPAVYNAREAENNNSCARDVILTRNNNALAAQAPPLLHCRGRTYFVSPFAAARKCSQFNYSTLYRGPFPFAPRRDFLAQQPRVQKHKQQRKLSAHGERQKVAWRFHCHGNSNWWRSKSNLPNCNTRWLSCKLQTLGYMAKWITHARDMRRQQLASRLRRRTLWPNGLWLTSKFMLQKCGL
jgi:hypothetical protein